jgi:hypothetical protein
VGAEFGHRVGRRASLANRKYFSVLSFFKGLQVGKFRCRLSDGSNRPVL